MRFRVIGADRQTGLDVNKVIEAATASAAEDRANRMGVMVERIDQVPGRHKPQILPNVYLDLQHGEVEVKASAGQLGRLVSWPLAAYARLWRQKKLLMVVGHASGVAGIVVALVATWSLGAATGQTKGLGWSVEQIEAKWGPQNGWRWYEKNQLADGRIDYLAKNENGRFYLRIRGNPRNIAAFVAGANVARDKLGDQGELLSLLAVPSVMVSSLTAIPGEALTEFLGLGLRRLLTRVESLGQTEHQESQVFGTTEVTLRFTIHGGGLMLMVTVQPADDR